MGKVISGSFLGCRRTLTTSHLPLHDGRMQRLAVRMQRSADRCFCVAHTFPIDARFLSAAVAEKIKGRALTPFLLSFPKKPTVPDDFRPIQEVPLCVSSNKYHDNDMMCRLLFQ